MKMMMMGNEEKMTSFMQIEKEVEMKGVGKQLRIEESSIMILGTIDAC